MEVEGRDGGREGRRIVKEGRMKRWREGSSGGRREGGKDGEVREGGKS